MSLCNDVAISAFLTRHLPRVADRQKGILLDLGCGQQPYQSIYKGLFKQVVTGDSELRSRINARLSSVALPFRDNSFDVVLISEVIEHIDEVSLTLSEISRILRPGGHLFITWPFMWPLHELPRDYTRFTEYGMERLLANSGLQIENLERRGDLLCLSLSIFEHLTFNGMESLARLPIMGSILFRPAQIMVTKAVRKLWNAYLYIVGDGERIRPRLIGEGLKGPLNHLALWTLGYCAKARKV